MRHSISKLIQNLRANKDIQPLERAQRINVLLVVRKLRREQRRKRGKV